MNLWQEARLVAAKDLRIEARSRVTMYQILPFGAIVLLLFAFALDPDRGVLARVAPGLFWVAVLLAALLAVSRSFAIEAANSARDGLRLSGLDGSAIFLGKAGAVALELLALEVVLGTGVALLYDVEFHSPALLVLAAVGGG
ncbi:MAG: heme exporter protein CcmB, partial [Acidimicrobiia bacterium]